jgi:hypothetical protein
MACSVSSQTLLLLLNHGADPTLRNKVGIFSSFLSCSQESCWQKGETFFHLACSNSFQREAISMILDRGFNPNLRNQQVAPDIALCHSAQHFFPFPLCLLFLQSMNTPLHCAIEARAFDNAALLLTKCGERVKIDAKNKVNRFPSLPSPAHLMLHVLAERTNSTPIGML